VGEIHELKGRVVGFPGSPWRLHQPFPPAGDQPEAIRLLTEGIEDGLSFQTLLGVTGSGKTYTMANVIARLGRPALVLAPNKTLAAQLYSEFREFFPENAVEYFVSYYDYYQPEAYVPSRDLFIEKDSSINEHIEQMRLSATKSLLERRDVVIVCTVSAIYGIGDPVDYHSMILHLRQGEKIGQREIIRRLTEMQYERNEMDFKRGVYRVRGDVIDVFPAENAESAVRITLFDDEIEGLTVFDPLTGHTRQKLGRFTVFPSSHYVTPRATVLKAVEAIKEELRQRIEFFQTHQKLVECQRIEQRSIADDIRNRDCLPELVLKFCNNLFNAEDMGSLAGAYACCDTIDIDFSRFRINSYLAKAVVEQFDCFFCVFLCDLISKVELSYGFTEANECFKLSWRDRNRFDCGVRLGFRITHLNIIIFDFFNGAIGKRGLAHPFDVREIFFEQGSLNLRSFHVRVLMEEEYVFREFLIFCCVR